MHYIIGTTITVNTEPQQSSGPRSVGSAPAKRVVNTEYFEPGKQYTIYYIKKMDGGIMYTFNEENTGDKISVTFGSAREADMYIARILGEKLPNYEDFYSKSN